MILALLLLSGAQPGPIPAPQPVEIRPGQTPEGVSNVPISEVAEPIALAVAGFDRDGNGATSRAEFDEGLARTFTGADTNRDGALGYIEYSNWATIWLGSATALPGPFAIDKDGDNRIAREEFATAFAAEFVRLDKNGDGNITHAELLTLRNPRMQPVFDRNGRPIRQPRRRD